MSGNEEEEEDDESGSRRRRIIREYGESSSSSRLLLQTSTSSSSRRRRGRATSEMIWPAPFIESLATHLAIHASLSFGPRSAAPALANFFQVCSTWRAISHSNSLLWHNLTRLVWHRTHLLHPSWYLEFIYRHRTASNFRFARSLHTTLHFHALPTPNNNHSDSFLCRSLALSDFHLASGFADGAVRLFDLTTRLHVSTFRPLPRDRLGRFSAAVSGIILSTHRLVFATLDGDIHVALLHNHNNTNTNTTIETTVVRRAHLGDVVNDGVLVDFSGSTRWWVGLYAGVPGRAIQVWNCDTEELVFLGGGSFTDPEAVMGWHLLTDLATQVVGRVRVTTTTSGREVAVACTGARVMVFDLMNQGYLTVDHYLRRGSGMVVGSFDVSNEAYVTVDTQGMASVCNITNAEQMGRFTTQPLELGTMAVACLNNTGYLLICAGAGGVIHVWDARTPQHIYRFRQRIGHPTAFITDDRHVAAASSSSSSTSTSAIHLWDFGA